MSNPGFSNQVSSPSDQSFEQVFFLPQIRHALRETPGARNILRLADAIERVGASDPHGVFDLCRALIESVCTTILNDLNAPFPGKRNSETLTTAVIERLKLFRHPKSVEADAKKACGETTGGINKFVIGIAEYRRKFGSASHGKDGYNDTIDISHAFLAVGVTDSIAAFLFNSHRRLHGKEDWARAELGDHKEFDRFLDDEHDPSPISVFGEPYEPSAVLFGVNRTAYLKRLNEWQRSTSSGESEEEQS